MEVCEFKQMIEEQATNKARSIFTLSDCLSQKNREDKYFREEWIAIMYYLIRENIPDNATIKLGTEREPWDALINEKIILEVTQALPEKAHEVRLAISTEGLTPETLFKHRNDCNQFPEAIIEAIKSKHQKNYPDSRVLIVVVLGEYTHEDDMIIEDWITEIQRTTEIGNFQEILLFELGRRKYFEIFKLSKH